MYLFIYQNCFLTQQTQLMEICKNCGHTITLNFCANCGQKAYRRIDKKYLWDEFQYTVLHTNKAFLYSVKNIIRNPGRTAREFIDGNRVNHYRPLLLVFLVSGFSTFLSFKVVKLDDAIRLVNTAKHKDSPFLEDVMTFLSSYSTLITLLLIPLLAIATYTSFKKWGHNYYEHIVINSYIYTLYTLLLCLVIYPIMYFFRHNPEEMVSISSYTFLLIPPLLIWYFKGFYPNQPITKIALRVLSSSLLAIALYTIIVILVCMGIFILSGNNEQTIEYVKPR
jgi:hypothetical protein